MIAHSARADPHALLHSPSDTSHAGPMMHPFGQPNQLDATQQEFVLWRSGTWNIDQTADSIKIHILLSLSTQRDVGQQATSGLKDKNPVHCPAP
jgi:hypothetical protein